jgi:hypothetical protein
MNKKEIELKIWSRTKTKGRTTFFEVKWNEEERCWDFVPDTNVNYLLSSIEYLIKDPKISAEMWDLLKGNA